MARMKSAFEKAMERVEQMERPRDEQLLEWKLVPQGERLGGEFLKGSGAPFTTLENASPEHRAYMVKGMLKVLVANVQLPRSEPARTSVDLVSSGLERLLRGNPKAKEPLERIRHVTTQYWENAILQREQAFAQLKFQMEQQVAEVMRRQMGGSAPMHANVETMPEFQQQWLAISGQIDQQYEQHLVEYRALLLELA